MDGYEMRDPYWCDTTREWEELNAPDPATNELKAAAELMSEALELVDKGAIKIMEAQSELENYPMSDVVGSFYDQLLDFENQLRSLKEKYERGDRG